MPDIIVIEPGLQERNYWRDLWRYRELFYVLAWRDLSVRYKQTVIGAAWAVIRPVLTMVIFTVIFGRIAKLPSDGDAPYPLMVFAGMLPWTFFASSLSEASGSLIGNANLISKVYFPRLIVPTATVVVAFADFLISFAILLVMMAWYRFAPGWQILAAAGLRPARLRRQHRPRIVAHRAQRQVPRLPTCHPVRRATGPVCLAGGIQFQRRPGPVAAAVFAQPDGRRDRRVSLVHPWRAERQLYLPGLAVSLAVAAFFLWFGIRRFRATEKSFADLI